jgi:DeoR family fructose operon transcriptional repressor
MHFRQRQVLALLQHGRLEYGSAARALGVTEMTVRRAVRALELRKLALPVKGGAIPYPLQASSPASGVDFSSDALKMSLAEALYARLQPLESLFIGTGSTTLCFAKVIALRRKLPLTVVTHSLNVASTLFRTPCKVFLLGGELRNEPLDLVGPAAEKNLEEYHVRWLISGCDGAWADSGFYTADISLSNLEKKLLRIADSVAIISDSSKFAHRALTRFASLQEVDLLVTDSGLSQEDTEKLEQNKIEIIKVEATA